MKNLTELIDELREVFDVGLWEFKLKILNKPGAASIWIDLDYRRFELKLFRDWKGYSPKEQASTLLHEFCHFFNAPLAALTDQLRDGKLVTENHATFIMEFCNSHAEQVLSRTLADNRLKDAIRRYVSAGGYAHDSGGGSGGRGNGKSKS